MTAAKPADENKALIRRLYEAIDEKEDDELVALYASDCVIHGAPGGGVERTGRDAVKQQIQVTREAFPEFTASIEAMVAEDDLVAARIAYTGTHEGEYLGVPATGEDVSFDGTNIFRIEDAEIAEVWPMVDALGVLQQVNATEVPSV